MPSKTRIKGLNDTKLLQLRKWWSVLCVKKTKLEFMRSALHDLGIYVYAPLISRRTVCDGQQNPIHTASITIGAATYYGESRSRLWALRRAIQNAVDDYEPLD